MERPKAAMWTGYPLIFWDVMLPIVAVWSLSRHKHHNRNVWRRSKMKSFRWIFFGSFLAVLLSVSFGTSLALADTATATFIWSIDSRYKYQPDSDRRLSTSFTLPVDWNSGESHHLHRLLSIVTHTGWRMDRRRTIGLWACISERRAEENSFSPCRKAAGWLE